ncbi:SRPBCC family protein [Rufibacter latericius]|uniref:SRPBCC domain-containing protein n=1 Tax=Rufibacter latericius TaxID=2487040 RepID=A0A3M9M8N0_9BACT|nr:SRPBCC domain-containing protein [Rufibacter latericius]RNI21914.1 SRPBCC domain-containing protein [Rufibacter latericius]
MEQTPIIIEQSLSAPVEKVWAALTDKDQMKLWYFDLAEFRPEVGFRFEFTGGTVENRYLHLCEVTEVEENSKLTYSWRYDGYEGISYVTFDLFPEGASTTLKLTHSGLETFPQDNPDFAKANFVEGWNHIIGISLPEYLEKD